MGQRIRLGGGAAPAKPRPRRSAKIKFGRKLKLWEMAVLALGVVAVVWGGIRYYQWIHPGPLVFPTGARGHGRRDVGTDMIMRNAGEAAKRQQ